MPAGAHLAGVNYAPIPGAGAALQFDGGNDYVTFGVGNTLASPTYTIETWFNELAQALASLQGRVALHQQFH